jgi:SAM-dependent methyltransferase
MPEAEDYDAIAGPYAAHVAGELAGKPFDRAWLDAFAARWAGRGPVADIGCGPGRVAAYLAARGVDALGLDLSEGMLAEARRLHPALRVERADMLALGARPGRFAAAVAFYALIHLDDAALARALASLRAALAPGGELLAAAHPGEGWLRPGAMWGVPVSLAFRLFREGELEAALGAAGLALEEVATRDPYPGVEYPTRRLYLRARAWA